MLKDLNIAHNENIFTFSHEVDKKLDVKNRILKVVLKILVFTSLILMVYLARLRVTKTF